MKWTSNLVLLTIVPYLIDFIVGVEKFKRMIQIIYYFIFVLLTDFLKSAYNDPRPYMVDSDVKVYTSLPIVGCGNPSGHAAVGIFMFLFILEDILGRKLFIKDQGCDDTRECAHHEHA